MKTYFTADHHFGHESIIGMCNRPFVAVDQMDRAMIAAWNEVVAPIDTVWHLQGAQPVPRGLPVGHC
jgi:calcineurin-like phosphoesterase family protein